MKLKPSKCQLRNKKRLGVTLHNWVNKQFANELRISFL